MIFSFLSILIWGEDCKKGDGEFVEVLSTAFIGTIKMAKKLKYE
jgi:hypothetical protein